MISFQFPLLVPDLSNCLKFPKFPISILCYSRVPFGFKFVFLSLIRVLSDSKYPDDLSSFLETVTVAKNKKISLIRTRVFITLYTMCWIHFRNVAVICLFVLFMYFYLSLMRKVYEWICSSLVLASIWRSIAMNVSEISYLSFSLKFTPFEIMSLPIYTYRKWLLLGWHSLLRSPR
jgi:hypothetical protein